MTALAGTGKLVRLALRRDRFLLPLWVGWLGLIPLLYVSATDGLYPDAAGLREYYTSVVTNPSLMAMNGPVYAPTLGALVMWRSGILAVIVGVVSLLVVIRHTRMEEDAGRRELLGSTVAGRQAPLAAALTVAFAGNLLMGTIMVVGLAGYGLPTAGAFAFGLAFVASGWTFAAVAGVAAQLTQGAGAARGIALAVLGLAFVLRAAGDSGGAKGDLAWLSWLSPIGWVQRVRPFADERWWVFALVAGLVLVALVAAVLVQSRRDLGAGLFAGRNGPADAPATLHGPVGLAWRLHRGLLAGWCTGFATIGLVMGGAASSIDTLVDGSSTLGQFLEQLGGTAALKDAYLATVFSMMALVIGAYAIQAALRARAEETALHAEPVLGTTVGRVRWLTSHLVFVVLGPALALAALGVTMGLTSADGDVGEQVSRVLAGAMVQLPAVWLVAAVTLAAFGLVPRAASAVAWTVYAGCGFLSFFGALLQLDQWVIDLSPFSHIPRLPGGDVTAAPLLWLLGITAVLAVVGLAGFRRRDLAS